MFCESVVRGHDSTDCECVDHSLCDYVVGGCFIASTVLLR